MCLAVILAPAAQAEGREDAKLITATEVMQELTGYNDEAIPAWLLDRAQAVVVVPDVLKVGFWVGGRAGRGAMLVRDEQGRYSDPVFVNLGGGSFGPQIGAQQTDVVLVFTTRKGVENIAEGKVTLGADASVAAGPVGRSASAATDGAFKAEVYSWSQSRGLFAGVALDGSALTIDNKANARFYGREVGASEIISGAVRSDSGHARHFVDTVMAAGTVNAAKPPATPAPAAASPAAASTPAAESGVQTFPLEADSSPR